MENNVLHLDNRVCKYLMLMRFMHPKKSTMLFVQIESIF